MNRARIHWICLPAALVLALTVSLPALGHADDLPPAREILDRAVGAMGGKKAINRIESIRIKSEMSVEGMSIISEAFWAKTGERLVKRTMPGMGEMLVGYDGKVGWTKNPMTGYTIVEEDEVEDMVNQAAYHTRLLTMDEQAVKDFSTLETVDQTTFANRDCYKIHVVRRHKDGNRDRNKDEGYMYFDAKTSMPVGFEMAEAATPRPGPTAGQSPSPNGRKSAASSSSAR